MSERYLFEFPYQFPAQRAFDDEQTRFVFILADNHKQALSWGAEIADKFYSLMDDVGSWKIDYGEGWIIEKPERRGLTPGQLSALPVVKAGEFPDMSSWLKP